LAKQILLTIFLSDLLYFRGVVLA